MIGLEFPGSKYEKTWPGRSWGEALAGLWGPELPLLPPLSDCCKHTCVLPVLPSLHRLPPMVGVSLPYRILSLTKQRHGSLCL